MTQTFKQRYLDSIYHAVGSKKYQHFYVTQPTGKRVDVLEGGLNSCASVVTNILYDNKLIASPHATVSSTLPALEEAGWVASQQPAEGDIILWGKSSEGHGHIGFLVRDKKTDKLQAISNSTYRRVPAQHSLIMRDGRQPIKFFTNNRLKESPMTIAVHNGNFHADDVFGVALVKQLYPDIAVVRTRDEAKLQAADIVADVGGVYDVTTRRFDHHQNGAPVRANGIVYSAFGLLWRQYGLKYCQGNKKVWQEVDERYVQIIDATDNGQKLYGPNQFLVNPFTMDDIVRLFNPLSLAENETFDQQFNNVLPVAIQILKRMRDSVADEIAAEELFLKKYQMSPDKRYVILDHYLPTKQVSKQLPALQFVVAPDEINNTWMLHTIHDDNSPSGIRRALPRAWAGLRDQALADKTGVKSAIFCHRSRFIAAAKTKSDILMLLQQALKA